jgi:hypothetical protein
MGAGYVLHLVDRVRFHVASGVLHVIRPRSCAAANGIDVGADALFQARDVVA